MIDKIEHFCVTSIITISVGYFLNLNIGIILSLIFSFSKEIYDYKVKREDFELKDLIADFLGIILGILVITFFSGN